MDMNDTGTRASRDYLYHHNKSKRISGFGSHDPKYYDQIITKLNLRAMQQQHERSLLQDQTTAISSGGSKKKKRCF
jgi:hypothetical protein